jgi:hypothetical protein
MHSASAKKRRVSLCSFTERDSNPDEYSGDDGDEDYSNLMNDFPVSSLKDTVDE